MSSNVVNALAKFFDAAQFPILFTGAGVSVRTGLPTWKSLVEQLAEGLRPTDPLSTQQMLERVNEGDYTGAVDYFYLSRKLVEGDKLKLLSKLLSDYDHRPILPIAQLPVRGCITTNFDRSILDAYAKTQEKSPRDYKFGDQSFKQAVWEQNSFVARIHGSVEHPSSIVLSDSQFSSLLKDESYIDFLSTCFTHRNVIFIGFSFYDPAIRHVFDQIDKRFGPASVGRHCALLPSDISSEFTQKAHRLNIQVISYDPKDSHAELWQGINLFVQPKSIARSRSLENTQKYNPLDTTKRYLAFCYARVKSSGTSTALRESVLEGIVSAMLQEVAPKSISRRDLLEKVRVAIGLKGRDGEVIVDNVLRSLADADLCRKQRSDSGRGMSYSWIGSTNGADSLTAAIETLIRCVKNRAYLQEGWATGKEVADTMTSFFTQLIKRRGWDLGAAFAAGRVPDSISITSLLNECAIGLSAFDQERLVRVCESMLQHPAEEESEILNELGRVSFALELAFQSPRSSLLHKSILPKRIYLDASVLLPAIVRGHPFSKIYSESIDRLKSSALKAAISLKPKVCSVYLNEIISHRKIAEAYSEQFGDQFPAIARSDVLFHGSTNTNVYVGAYANWIETHGDIKFNKFLQQVAPYTNESQLRRWLNERGFDVFDQFKSGNFSSFYSILEKGYASSISHGKNLTLLEHDAIQLSLLDSEITRGEKSIFVTADKKLQYVVSESNYSFVAEAMISHVGLIQFIDLVLGGTHDGVGLTELLWSAKVSDRAHAVRSFFTQVGLSKYDAGIAMTMPKIIEEFADRAADELDRTGVNLDTDDPIKRADAFRVLGTLERNYLDGMREAVEKLNSRS